MHFRIALLAVVGLLSGCTTLWLRDWPNNTLPVEAASPLPANLRASFETLPGSPIAHVTLRILDGNPAAWAARWRLLARARTTIDTSYFILSQDVFGMAFLGHLLKKAEEGVRVRILLDAQGRLMSRATREIDCLPALVGASKVDIKVYRPMPLRVAQALLTLNPLVAAASTHDKIIVVDGQTGLTGGRNIEAVYFADPSELSDAFHDVDVAIESREAAAFLTDAFQVLYESDQAKPIRASRDGKLAHCLRDMRAAYHAVNDWLRAAPAAPETTVHPVGHPNSWREDIAQFMSLRGILNREAEPPYRGEVRIVNSLPRFGSSNDPISRSLLQLLAASSSDVFVENPYVVLTQRLVSAMEDTGERGVPITIVTNGPLSTDNALSWQVFHERWPELLARVPGLRLFVNGTHHNVHSKFAVFDQQLTLLGTYNLDPISMTINGEIALVVWSPAFAERMMQRPRHWLAQGPPELHHYRIQRDASGRPRRNEAGEILVLYGAEDHTDPKDWPPVGCTWQFVRAAACLPMMPPIF